MNEKITSVKFDIRMNVTADIAGGTVQDCREMVRRAIMGR